MLPFCAVHLCGHNQVVLFYLILMRNLPSDFSLLQPLYLIAWKCLKSFIKEMVQHMLKPHIKPVVLRFLNGSAAPLSCQTAPSMEPDTHKQLGANSGHNSHVSSAVCWNGAQREIKRIRLFQNDRLPCCPGPISCDSPASLSLYAAESFPGDWGKVLYCGWILSG